VRTTVRVQARLTTACCCYPVLVSLYSTLLQHSTVPCLQSAVLGLPTRHTTRTPLTPQSVTLNPRAGIRICAPRPPWYTRALPLVFPPQVTPSTGIGMRDCGAQGAGPGEGVALKVMRTPGGGGTPPEHQPVHRGCAGPVH